MPLLKIVLVYSLPELEKKLKLEHDKLDLTNQPFRSVPEYEIAQKKLGGAGGWIHALPGLT